MCACMYVCMRVCILYMHIYGRKEGEDDSHVCMFVTPFSIGGGVLLIFILSGSHVISNRCCPCYMPSSKPPLPTKWFSRFPSVRFMGGGNPRRSCHCYWRSQVCQKGTANVVCVCVCVCVCTLCERCGCEWSWVNYLWRLYDPPSRISPWKASNLLLDMATGRWEEKWTGENTTIAVFYNQK